MALLARRGTRGLAALFLLLGPVACGRSCGCVEGEKTYETLEGKVKVELVRNVHWSAGKIPGPATAFHLRVHTEPVIDHPISCDRVDMAEAPSGKLVAYRCKGTSAWNVLRLRGANRYIADCAAPVGTGSTPKLDAIDSLSVGGSRILGCASTEYAYRAETAAVWAELVTSIEEDEGAASTSAFLVATASRAHDASGTDPWGKTLETRSGTIKSAVMAQVCPALAKGDAAMPLYVRAAERCPPTSPGVGEAAIRQLQTALVRPGLGMAAVERASQLADGGSDGDGRTYEDQLFHSHRLAAAWAALFAVANAREAAGRAMCALAPSLTQPDGNDDHPGPRAYATAVMAAAKTKCPAAVAWLSPPPCSSELDCDGGLCSAQVLGDELDTWSAFASKPGPRELPFGPPLKDRSKLAFAYAQGSLDHETIVRNARRTYAWTAPSPGLPECGDEDAGNGTPCRCFHADYPTFLCDIPAAKTTGSYSACAFAIDDPKKRIGDVKRICTGRTESCLSAPCCAGLRCQYGDGGAECVPRETTEAGTAREH